MFCCQWPAVMSSSATMHPYSPFFVPVCLSQFVVSVCRVFRSPEYRYARIQRSAPDYRFTRILKSEQPEARFTRILRSSEAATPQEPAAAGEPQVKVRASLPLKLYNSHCTTVQPSSFFSCVPEHFLNV